MIPVLSVGGALAYATGGAAEGSASVTGVGSGSGHQSSGPAGVPTGTEPSPTGPTGGSVQQTVGVSVLPGPLTVSPGSEAVGFATAGIAGRTSVYRGDLAPVTVVDARGSLVGWQATVSLQSIGGVDAARLDHALLCADPAAPTMVAGNPADVVRQAERSCAGVGGTVTLFSAAPGGGGGAYGDTASLSLLLPGGALPDQVTASLTVSVH